MANYEMLEPSVEAEVPADITLTWQNINLYVTNTHGQLFRKNTVTRTKLLHNVSGIAKTGKLCAIMGPSGSGKTTLLTAIGQRNTGILDGEIKLNGRSVTKDLSIRMSCFVPQKDLAIKSLTVKEHLYFMANLKMDARLSQAKKINRIERLCEEFNLLHHRWSKLCDLSGGEMKRVSIAVQMLSDPPLLLCDEPTTGLDSFSASQIVNHLRDFAAQGKVVIASIHQPASGIFEMFDNVCLLTTGGKLAYFGEVDDAKTHFAKLGFVLPDTYNTAEYFISKLSTDSEVLSRKFGNSKAYISMIDEIHEISNISDHNDRMNQVFLKAYDFKSVSACAQLKLLAWRSTVDLYRNLSMVFIQVILYAITALMIALPVTRSSFNQVGIQNIQGRNFSAIIETGFAQSYTVLNTFPAEIPVVLRDIGNGLYKPVPYYVAKVFILVIRTTLEALMFAAIIYLVSGANGDSSFEKFVFPVVLCAITSAAYGCCVSAMFEDIAVATQMMNPIDFVSYIFTGLVYKLSAAPVYLIWLKYVSRFYFAYEGMSILQWSEVDEIECSANKDLPCIKTGLGVIAENGYDVNNLLLDFFGLVLMFFVFNIIGYAFLLKRSKKASSY